MKLRRASSHPAHMHIVNQMDDGDTLVEAQIETLRSEALSPGEHKATRCDTIVAYP